MSPSLLLFLVTCISMSTSIKIYVNHFHKMNVNASPAEILEFLEGAVDALGDAAEVEKMTPLEQKAFLRILIVAVAVDRPVEERLTETIQILYENRIDFSEGGILSVAAAMNFVDLSVGIYGSVFNVDERTMKALLGWIVQPSMVLASKEGRQKRIQKLMNDAKIAESAGLPIRVLFEAVY